MNRVIRVLGIETSCDETASAVVEAVVDENGRVRGPGRVLSNAISGQFEAHALYGGVVPEIAARAHVEKLDATIQHALLEAGLSFDDLDGVAVTAGPGLIGGVMVGVMMAKAICMSTDLPLLAINHLEGHALTVRLTHGVSYPYILLLVSGGHTQIVHVTGLGTYRRLGTTIDDAVGEAFDKTAKLLGLGHPGGPAVERAARSGDPNRFPLPRPLLDRPGCDFSFAGLKTAVRQTAERFAPLSDSDVSDLCAAFQQAVATVLQDRLANALQVLHDDNPTMLVAAGGVAANQRLSQALSALGDRTGIQVVVPPPQLCTDNGAMIAWAGCERLAAGHASPLDIMPRARWPLDEHAEPKIGSGKHGAKA